MKTDPVTASRSALLDIRREKDLVEQGFHFLDEKRLQLARELMRQMEDWRAFLETFESAENAATGRFREAMLSHGLLDLQVHPVGEIKNPLWTGKDRGFLGLTLPQKILELSQRGAPGTTVMERPAAEQAAEAYHHLVKLAAEGALILTTLLRLEAEYRRTERSVRALENVVLPEITARLKRTEDALAELEQEEAVRVRLFTRKHSGAGTPIR
ncbi:MAG: hypothetical protein OEZ23_03990 [Gammaproteobacteria bacterium]|nr:hypothetical protein [Gammaproteobacteria bacterium]